MNQERILVVEDEPKIAELHRDISNNPDSR